MFLSRRPSRPWWPSTTRQSWQPALGIWLASAGLSALTSLPAAANGPQQAAPASVLTSATTSAPSPTSPTTPVTLQATANPPLHSEPPAADWAAANAQVARFPRGHADVLAAERRQSAQHPLHALTPPLPTLPDANALVRTAVRNRPDVWITAGDGAVDMAGKQAATAAATRDVLLAWWQAAAAAQEASLTAQQLEAAQLGHELADRMARVGNWSEAQRLQQAQTLLTARAEHQQALQHAQDTWQQLWPMAGVRAPETGTAMAQAEPSACASASDRWTRLPPLPTDAERDAALAALTQRPDWQHAHTAWQRAMAALPPGQASQLAQTLDTWLATALPAPGTTPDASTQPSWPSVLTTPPVVDRRTLVLPAQWDRALDTQSRWQRLDSQLRLQTLQAWQRLHSAWATAHTTLTEQLPTAQAQEQQAQTRYNGMLASTWDLLDATRARLIAQRQAVQAVRNAALAWTDWQAVRAGADPALTDLAAPATAANPGTDRQGH